MALCEGLTDRDQLLKGQLLEGDAVVVRRAISDQSTKLGTCLSCLRFM